MGPPVHWKRLPYLFDRSRLPECRRLFRRPLRALAGLSFVRRGAVTLETRCGRTITFSRAGRDHWFWDAYFERPLPLEFTPDGCLQMEYDGRTLFLRPQTSDFLVFREVFLQDEYGLRQSSRSYGTVVDVGANAGMFTCAVLPRAKRVVSVEAVRANHEHAVRNVTANGGSAGDVLHRALAARSDEQIRLYHNPRNSGGHSTAADWAGNSRRRQSAIRETNDFELCTTISLGDLLERAGAARVDLLKCDIEGAEYDAFLDAPADVLSRIAELVMEVHVSPAHPPEMLRALIERLQASGFDVRSPREPPETDRVDSFVIRGVRHSSVTA